MTIYYKIQNNQITQTTSSPKIAQALGFEVSQKAIKRGYNGQLYFEDELPQPPEPTYAEKRAAEYPSVEEQLDMIYWDKVNNTNKWQETIAAIKAKYPKI